MPGSVINADTVRNVRTSVAMAMPFELASSMRTGKIDDEVFRVPTYTIVVEVLINRFVANAQVGKVDPESSRDLFGRPSEFELAHDVTANAVVFQAWTLVRNACAFSCTLLSTTRMIHAVHRRAIPSEFSRDRAFRPIELVGYLVQRLSLRSHDGNLISLLGSQMSELFLHNHLRLLLS
jgi:hypothetical protein